MRRAARDASAFRASDAPRRRRLASVDVPAGRLKANAAAPNSASTSRRRRRRRRRRRVAHTGDAVLAHFLVAKHRPLPPGAFACALTAASDRSLARDAQHRPAPPRRRLKRCVCRRAKEAAAARAKADVAAATAAAKHRRLGLRKRKRLRRRVDVTRAPNSDSVRTSRPANGRPARVGSQRRWPAGAARRGAHPRDSRRAARSRGRRASSLGSSPGNASPVTPLDNRARTRTHDAAHLDLTARRRR